jgi:hypothetical protein
LSSPGALFANLQLLAKASRRIQAKDTKRLTRLVKENGGLKVLLAQAELEPPQS